MSETPQTRDPSEAEEAFMDAQYSAVEEALEAGLPPGQIRTMLRGVDRWLAEKMGKHD